MVKVRIHNMMFYGFHGYYEYEREQGQKFFFDVELKIEDDKAMDTVSTILSKKSLKIRDFNSRQHSPVTSLTDCWKNSNMLTRQWFASASLQFLLLDRLIMLKLKLHVNRKKIKFWTNTNALIQE